jgi:hypothetical protein
MAIRAPARKPSAKPTRRRNLLLLFVALLACTIPYWIYAARKGLRQPIDLDQALGCEPVPGVEESGFFDQEQYQGRPFRHYWGIGEPGRPPKDQTGSWGYALLPFLEQQAMYETRTWTLPLAVYNCPGRRSCTALKAPAKDEYATYPGGGWTWGKTDYSANSLVVPDRPNCLRLEDLTDGTSHTLLAGEKAMDPRNYQTGTWFWDEPFFTGGAGGTARAGTKLLRDAPGIPFPYNWGSPHAAGAQFVLADGSVQLLAFGTPRRIVQALLTPAGGEVVPNPF